jgi:hypothetical protein
MMSANYLSIVLSKLSSSSSLSKECEKNNIQSRTKYLNSYRRENWEMIKAEISGSLLKEIETLLKWFK